MNIYNHKLGGYDLFQQNGTVLMVDKQIPVILSMPSCPFGSTSATGLMTDIRTTSVLSSTRPELAGRHREAFWGPQHAVDSSYCNHWTPIGISGGGSIYCYVGTNPNTAPYQQWFRMDLGISRNINGIIMMTIFGVGNGNMEIWIGNSVISPNSTGNTICGSVPLYSKSTLFVPCERVGRYVWVTQAQVMSYYLDFPIGIAEMWVLSGCSKCQSGTYYNIQNVVSNGLISRYEFEVSNHCFYTFTTMWSYVTIVTSYVITGKHFRYFWQ